MDDIECVTRALSRLRAFGSRTKRDADSWLCLIRSEDRVLLELVLDEAQTRLRELEAALEGLRDPGDHTPTDRSGDTAAPPDGFPSWPEDPDR